MMVNASGHNGVDNGIWPSDEVLKASLLKYAEEHLTLEKRILRLASDHNIHIRPTKLKQLNKQFNIPTVRKPPSHAVATTLICEKIDEDTHGANGPNYVKKILADEGRFIPRSVVREVMDDNAPWGAARRYPGNCTRIHRTVLDSPGVFHEVNCDGHEKLSSAALRMGEVGIPIYGMRDKCSGKFLRLTVVPNARIAVAIGHVYIDFIEEYGAIPLQITVDKGSETGDMFAMQTSLRENFTSDLDIQQWPAFVALKSTNNTTIEGGWRWLRKSHGHNMKEVILEGKTNGLFNPGNDVHVNLFHWLWPQIVQICLDQFVRYWNTHRVRKQNNKKMPSGATPDDVFARPEAYGYQRLSQPIPQEAIDELRKNLELLREEALQWVDEDFEVAVQEAFKAIGSPKLSLGDGWKIFSQMAPLLEHVYFGEV